MKQFFLNLAAFTKRERRGAFVLILVLVIIILINNQIPRFVSTENNLIPEDTAIINKWIGELKHRKLNLSPFNPNQMDMQKLIKMGLPASICSSWSKYLDAGGKFYDKKDVRRLYGMNDSVFYKVEPNLIIPTQKKRKNKTFNKEPERELKNFDPNKFTFDQLVGAGLEKTIASNIINYRNSIGEFLTKEDLKKLYAIDEDTYKSIASYIIIEPAAMQVVKIDSVELNSTTFEELIEIGISRKTAKGIVGYRNVLGGFYRISQLSEVYSISEEEIKKLQEASWIDTLLIRKINFNKADEYQLSQHPYISKRQARQLLKYKRFASKVDNFKEIESLNVFSDDLAPKLRKYFAF